MAIRDTCASGVNRSGRAAHILRINARAHWTFGVTEKLQPVESVRFEWIADRQICHLPGELSRLPRTLDIRRPNPGDEAHRRHIWRHLSCARRLPAG
jgi:hypothetical protein